MALRAVSGSRYSQKPYPFGLPVARSFIMLKRGLGRGRGGVIVEVSGFDLGADWMMMMIWALGRRNKAVIWRPCADWIQAGKT